MTRIEIVTHCYCPPGMEHYAEMLAWQMKWIDLAAANGLDVRHVIFKALGSLDLTTLQVLLDHSTNRDVERLIVCQPVTSLFNRCEGRNMRARETDADVVWFADADYFFGPRCLRWITENVGKESGLVYPRVVNTSIDHETGDRMLAKYKGKDKTIEQSLFWPENPPRAIGGIQIVGRDKLREVGYCEGTKFAEPDANIDNWKFKSDVVFRKSCGGSSPVDVPDVYRIRHTLNGY